MNSSDDDSEEEVVEVAEEQAEESPAPLVEATTSQRVETATKKSESGINTKGK